MHVTCSVGQQDFKLSWLPSVCTLTLSHDTAVLSSVPLLCRVLFVLDRAGDMQIGLTAEEKQQLQGVSLEELLCAFRAASAKFSTGSSAYRGVYYNKGTHRYRARFRPSANSKQVNLGSFVSEEEAAHAYDKAVRQHHGRCSLERSYRASCCSVTEWTCMICGLTYTKQH